MGDGGSGGAHLLLPDLLIRHQEHRIELLPMRQLQTPIVQILVLIFSSAHYLFANQLNECNKIMRTYLITQDKAGGD